MTKYDVSKNTIFLNSSLREAMISLDKGVGGVLFCIENTGVMSGILTDGDIRRALLAGKTLDDRVDMVMNRTFISGDFANSHIENLALLSEKIRHVPILNENGFPVDLISWVDLWRLSVSEPSLGGNEKKYVMDCIDSGWISSQGDYIDKFQQAFSQYIGVGNALCTSSGTTALHLALKALEIGEGDEVLVPNITFGACANAVIHAGAKPVFVDIDQDTWTISIAKIEDAISEKTKAIMPVHLYGHPCEMEQISNIAKKYSLKIIEDCAQALGAEYKGRRVGTFGDVACFSFFANKVITTGEGGMVVTRDKQLFNRMALLRDHGMSKDRRYWHVEAGFNYRMTNLQAAVGLAQLERIDSFLNLRAQVTAIYDERLGAIEGLFLPPNAKWAKNIHWLYCIEIEEEMLGMSRGKLAEMLKEEGYETRNIFPPLHIQPAFGSGELGEFPVSERLSERVLCLPTSNAITLEHTKSVCSAIEKIVDNVRIFSTR